MIADMFSNKNLNPIVTEIFTRGRKLNICTEKPYSFLVIDTTLALDNPSRFRKNLLERT